MPEKLNRKELEERAKALAHSSGMALGALLRALDLLDSCTFADDYSGRHFREQVRMIRFLQTQAAAMLAKQEGKFPDDYLGSPCLDLE